MKEQATCLDTEKLVNLAERIKEREEEVKGTKIIVMGHETKDYHELAFDLIPEEEI